MKKLISTLKIKKKTKIIFIKSKKLLDEVLVYKYEKICLYKSELKKIGNNIKKVASCYNIIFMSNLYKI